MLQFFSASTSIVNSKRAITECLENARIVGCTGGGIIGKDGPNESMKALAIMAIKGPGSEFAITFREKNAEGDPYRACYEMALELKRQNHILFMN